MNSMRNAGILGAMLAVAGCGERLEGTTWKGQFQKDTVKLEFVSSASVKCTWTRDWNGTPMSTTADRSYAIDGKSVLFKTGDKVNGKALLEKGEMVGTPVDFGFENLDSSARVVVRREP